MNTQSLRNALLCQLDERIKASGVASLAPDELTFWGATYSLGVIRNEGLHGFMFWFDEYLERDISVNAFMDLGVDELAVAIVNVGELLIDYVTTKDESELSADGFRGEYSEQLDAMEELIAPLKDLADQRLSELAARICGVKSDSTK